MLRVLSIMSLCVSIVLGMLFLAGASPALGAYASWVGSVSSDWDDVSNWDAEPTGSFAIIFQGTPNLPEISTTDSVDTLSIATWTGSTTGSSLAIHSGADLTVGPGYIGVGMAGVGSITQDGGDVHVGGMFVLGNEVSAAGSFYDISGGSLTLQDVGGSTPRMIGGRGASTMNVSGTAVVTVHGIGGPTGGALGLDIGGHLSGGSVLPDSVGTSMLNQTGGTVNLMADLPALRLGVGTNTTGIYNLDGGTLNLATNIDNMPGTGYLNINGGTLNFTGNFLSVDYLNIGTKDGATGSFALEGSEAMYVSTLVTIGNGTGVGTLDILGGTTAVTDLTFGNAASVLRLAEGESLNILQSSYSLADALADVSNGNILGYGVGIGVNVSTVDIGGTAYTQLLGSPVPEPSGIAMLVAGVLGIMAYAWRKRR